MADRFEEHRGRLRAVAYRMLGSLTDADDALQEAWLRVDRADASEVENLSGWLTTIVARICLNMLRTRSRRREEPLDAHVPDPIISVAATPAPDEQVLLADAVGLALLIVLDSLSPVERLAFVLHDLFDLPFAEIAPMVDRTPVATRQLASRARRRVRLAGSRESEPDLVRQREVVDAFFHAARGRLRRPRRSAGPRRAAASRLRPSSPGLEGYRGAAEVAGQARGVRGADVRPVLVNGAAGALVTIGGRPFALMGFTVAEGRIVEINAIADPARVGRIAAAVLGGGT